MRAIGPLLVALLAGCGGGSISGPSDGGPSDDGGTLPDGGSPLPDGGSPLPDGGAGAPDATADTSPVYGAELAVATDGDDSNPGTLARPFATLERARAAVRDLKAAGLPAHGVVVWVRGGRYERSATFTLDASDSGEDGRPVVYRGYPGEEARLIGGRVFDPAWFAPTTSASPRWGRIDPAARGQLVEVDLGAHGLTDYGALARRGFGVDGVAAALELSFNRQPMTLGRWPDATDDDPPQTAALSTLTIYGDPSPDVTGTYTASGTSDGVNAYVRQGLVGGLQYRLYRSTWTYQGTSYTAWFLTTTASGYPSNTDPWWSLYDAGLGALAGSNGATGTPTTVVPGALNHGFASIATAPSDTTFTYFGSRPARWLAAEEVWLHGYWKYMWADLHMPVAGIDPATSSITLPDVPGYGLAAGQPFYAENLLEEITTPGEWYLDRTIGILYFWPPGDLASGETVVSTLAGPLIALSGAAYVTLADLTLEVGRTTLIEVDAGAHVSVERCTLRSAGTDAALLDGSDVGLERCTVIDPGDRGVGVTGGIRASLTSAGNYVRNCDISRFGRWSWTYKPAVDLAGVGHTVEHNRLHGAPHAAVLYSGNEHLLQYNEIHDVCAFSSDAGAIYSGRDWGYRGNRIRTNFIHDIASVFPGFGVHGVYLDDCLSGIEVFGNVFYRITGNAIEHGGGRDNHMENNLIARCGVALAADDRGLVWIVGTPGSDWNLLERLGRDGVQYQADPWATAYPALAAIPNDWAVVSDPANLWLYPQGCTFSRNLGWQNGQFTVEDIWAGTGVFDKYQEMADNVADADPHFVDEASLDLSLQPDSPAYAIPGFQPIPFASIGIEP